MSKVAAALVLGTAGVRFFLGGVHQLSAVEGWEDAAGLVGLLLTALAVYAAFAIELEDVQGREVLPIGRRGVGVVAVNGSLFDQLRRIDAARPRYDHQRGLAVGIRRLDIGSRLEERAEKRRIREHRGFRHRGRAEVVHRFHACARPNQPLHEIDVAVVRGPVQRGRTVGFRGVDVGLLLDQRKRRGAVARLRRVDERGRRKDERNHEEHEGHKARKHKCDLSS